MKTKVPIIGVAGYALDALDIMTSSTFGFAGTTSLVGADAHVT